jgi:hypothetical protein
VDSKSVNNFQIDNQTAIDNPKILQEYYKSEELA